LSVYWVYRGILIIYIAHEHKKAPLGGHSKRCGWCPPLVHFHLEYHQNITQQLNSYKWGSDFYGAHSQSTVYSYSPAVLKNMRRSTFAKGRPVALMTVLSVGCTLFFFRYCYLESSELNISNYISQSLFQASICDIGISHIHYYLVIE
jgi:hypothetical protein